MSHSVTNRRFRVAFSFAGEKRAFVAEVADLLSQHFGKDAILYDKFHEAEFARHDLGLYLPKLYSEQSDLIVPILCRDYSRKLWTGWEWNHIFALLNREDGSRVMPGRFDHATCDGLSPTCGYIELDNKTAAEFAALILERLAKNEGKSRDHYFDQSTSDANSGSNLNNAGDGGAVNVTSPAQGQPLIESAFGDSSASSWFSQRFKKTFPGMRNEVRWITDPQEAVSRLQRLLQSPLIYKDYAPAWWFRGRSNNVIRDFRLICGHTVLMDLQELEIDRVAAIDCGQYWNHAVYVQVRGVSPSGADQAAIDHRTEMISRRGYCHEEVCLFRGRYLDQKFHDDGAAEIDGKVVDLNDESEVRIRYLSPYNLLISGHDSAINNNAFDSEQEQLMNRALTDPNAVEMLAQKLSKLPKQVQYYRA